MNGRLSIGSFDLFLQICKSAFAECLVNRRGCELQDDIFDPDPKAKIPHLPTQSIHILLGLSKDKRLVF